MGSIKTQQEWFSDLNSLLCVALTHWVKWVYASASLEVMSLWQRGLYDHLQAGRSWSRCPLSLLQGLSSRYLMTLLLVESRSYSLTDKHSPFSRQKPERRPWLTCIHCNRVYSILSSRAGFFLQGQVYTNSMAPSPPRCPSLERRH